MTAWKRRTGTWSACWAERPPTFRWPPVILRRARIVAVVGDDFAEEDTELLASRGIDLEGLERVPGKTFFWAGKYSDDMNDRVTLTTDLNVFADFNPKLPESYRNARYLLLGNIQPGLQRSVSRADEALRLAGGDTMNFWISISRDELLATIRDWDFLLINDHRSPHAFGRNESAQSRAKDSRHGPAYAGDQARRIRRHAVPPNSYFIVPGYLLEDVFDPTGAGDCFAGGFIGYLAEHGFDLEAGHISRGDLSRAVIYGSVMGSFCCENFGVERLRTLSRAEIDARFDEFRAFTHF